MRKLFLFLFILLGVTEYSISEYDFSNEPIDIVIPCVKKDLPILRLCINGIKKNCTNIGRIIVISPERLTHNAEWFPESHFPFTIDDVAYYLLQENANLAKSFVAESNSRAGWYYQQLLKLYAPFVIPNISSNVLVVDADTVFLNPVVFTNSQNGGLYNPGTEYFKEYFNHIERLTDGLVCKLYPQHSGISHHMLFQRPVLEDLFNLIESIHNMDFWMAFCSMVDPSSLRSSGASEFELYFNFVMSRSKRVGIRKLKWENIRNPKELKKYKKKKYHYISCHSYQRVTKPKKRK
ncbi:MAG: hypothetical protein VX777_01145 [Chlamydiota bacterium]|nr:hypothetical protein [Chlamydiota bacterium]